MHQRIEDAFQGTCATVSGYNIYDFIKRDKTEVIKLKGNGNQMQAAHIWYEHEIQIEEIRSKRRYRPKHRYRIKPTKCVCLRLLSRYNGPIQKTLVYYLHLSFHG